MTRGPELYATSDGLGIFALYPTSVRFPASDSKRIGSAVDSCDQIAERFTREVMPTYPRLATLHTDLPNNWVVVLQTKDEKQTELSNK